MRNVLIAVLFLALVILLIVINSKDNKSYILPNTHSSADILSIVDTTSASQVNIRSTGIIDSATITKLRGKFKIKKDEFEGSEWYIPKTAPAYNNRNGIYCYFDGNNGTASNLRLKIQYLDDDWLFIKNYQFLIDGQTYTYIPNDVKRDNGSGDIWEWSDDNVRLHAKELIKALSTAKSVKIKLNGSQYYDTRTVSPTQLTSIKETLEMYEAMGGTL